MAKKENKIEISGDNNIVIQDCNLNDLTVNGINITQIEETLSRLLNKRTPSIKILIITTTLQSIEKELSNRKLHEVPDQGYMPAKRQLQMIVKCDSQNKYNPSTYIVAANKKLSDDIIDNLNVKMA